MNEELIHKLTNVRQWYDSIFLLKEIDDKDHRKIVKEIAHIIGDLEKRNEVKNQQ